MLTAYFDESAHGDRFLVVGGFVSTADKWACFSRDCERIKSEFEIPYVHAVKLFDPNSTRLYGHLSMERRIAVAAELIRSIRDFAEFSVVETIFPRQFNSLTTKEWRDQNGAPYQMCFQMILCTLNEWLCVPNNEAHTVSIFLEDGHRNAGGAEEIIRGYKAWSDDDPDAPVAFGRQPLLKIGGYGRLTKETAPQLWAADLISYCMYRRIVHKDMFFSHLMDKIEERVPIVGACINKEMIELLKEASIEGRALLSEWQRDTHELVKYLGQFGVRVEKHRKGILFDLSNATLPPDLSES